MLYFLSRRWAIFAEQVNECGGFPCRAKNKSVMSAANLSFVVRGEVVGGIKTRAKRGVYCSRTAVAFDATSLSFKSNTLSSKLKNQGEIILD